jgi:N-methylhydantoinase A
LRYVGQNFELPSQLRSSRFDANAIVALVDDFHAIHAKAYGYNMPERAVEIVNLRLAVTVQRPTPPFEIFGVVGNPEAAIIEERQTWFPSTGYVATPVYDRDKIAAGAQFTGPAIIEQMDTTTVVPPHAEVEIDRLGNIMITLAESSMRSLQ